MADRVTFVLRFLPGFSASHPRCRRLFFWFFPVTSPLSSSIYSVRSNPWNLSGKVWLFNFLAAVCQWNRSCSFRLLLFSPPSIFFILTKETSIFFSAEPTLFSCQPSYRSPRMILHLHCSQPNYMVAFQFQKRITVFRYLPCYFKTKGNHSNNLYRIASCITTASSPNPPCSSIPLNAGYHANDHVEQKWRPVK